MQEKVLDSSTLGLQVVTWLLLLVCMVTLILMFPVYRLHRYLYYQQGDEEICEQLLTLFLLSVVTFCYLVASFLNFGGCVHFAGRFSLSTIGPSFYLCMTSFIWNWVVLALLVTTSFCGYWCDCARKVHECLRCPDFDEE